jgi:hypothetical protein
MSAEREASITIIWVFVIFILFGLGCVVGSLSCNKAATETKPAAVIDTIARPIVPDIYSVIGCQVVTEPFGEKYPVRYSFVKLVDRVTKDTILMVRPWNTTQSMGFQFYPRGN